MAGEHVNWFYEDKCNLDCPYCFGPMDVWGPNYEQRKILAGKLIGGGVEKVTMGGGEPTLGRGLVPVLRMLSDAGIETSVHTNGLLLNEKMLDQMAGITDIIGLPVDSLNPRTQARLRGERFNQVLEKMPYLMQQIHDRGINVEIHTVFNNLNRGDIQGIYRFLTGLPFDKWKIYEFNAEMARGRAISEIERLSDEGLIERLEEIDKLEGPRTPEKGDTDCLFAKFLFLEFAMKRHDDPRIDFVGIYDPSRFYTFLDNRGDVSYYSEMSYGERRLVGNLFVEDFSKIKEKLSEIENKQMFFDETANDDFVERFIHGRPFWAAFADGDNFDEEAEIVKSQYWPLIDHLANLYDERMRSQLKETA